MGKKNEINLSCDLCEWPAKNFASEKTAKEEGWLSVGHESYYEDRSFYDSWICPTCVNKIESQIKKRLC